MTVANAALEHVERLSVAGRRIIPTCGYRPVQFPSRLTLESSIVFVNIPSPILLYLMILAQSI